MNGWAEIYNKEIAKTDGYRKYLFSKLQEKKPLLKCVIKYTKRSGRILEAGCGTGALSICLSKRGFRVTATDIDEKMLKIAKEINKYSPNKVILKKCNLFKLNYPLNFFDVVFSHGVLEHFPDEDIISLLNIELKIAKTVIISVPSNYFREKDKMFGNERFLSRRKWEEIIGKTNGSVIEEFGFHYLKGWQRFWHILVRMKLFGPHPYFTFALQKKPNRP